MDEIYRCPNCGFDHDKYPADNKCQACRCSDPLKKVETKTVPIKKISIRDFKKSLPKPVKTPKHPLRPSLPHSVHDPLVSSTPPTHSEPSGESPAPDIKPWCISINEKINVALFFLTIFSILLIFIIEKCS